MGGRCESSGFSFDGTSAICPLCTIFVVGVCVPFASMGLPVQAMFPFVRSSLMCLLFSMYI